MSQHKTCWTERCPITTAELAMWALVATQYLHLVVNTQIGMHAHTHTHTHTRTHAHAYRIRGREGKREVEGEGKGDETHNVLIQSTCLNI